eukprot:TRINITY_DN7283_c0_g1_i3.p1 TRINITY_DN7283_c0_g1~~TRINITY_DN7283_c0_g1_i3.p1  ORF type:complete len:336 (+),score=78.32 TRINITY_DN7283_c0_g1_i3:193-1200(+)
MADKILVIGGTGRFGSCIVQASIDAGHATCILIRESTAKDPRKAQLLESLKASGVTIICGSIDDHSGLVETIKTVDVVISVFGCHQILEQTKIIKAIKAAGNVKRYLPSEFGVDVDRVPDAVEPAKTLFASKARIRREIEAEGIPYTYVNCYFAATIFLACLGQYPITETPPTDKVTIYGDGNVKVVYNKEADVARYTIKAVDDPRALNKTLHIRPPENTLSTNELVGMWEKKIGKPLEKIYVTEEQLLKLIADSPFPEDERLGVRHVSYIKGNQTNFKMGENDVQATDLYPDVKYTTVDELLNQYILKEVEKSSVPFKLDAQLENQNELEVAVQ